MNIQQAKTIPIEHIIERLWCKRTKQANGAIWYLSPFRQERTASFKVNTQLNTRYDFGLADGGDGIKFIQDLKHTSVRWALDILDSGSFTSLANTQQQAEIHISSTPKRSLELLSTQAIQYFPLKSYLEERRIAPEIYRKYLVQVHYSAWTGKRFIALGFQNDAGDYEVRNKHFKGLVGTKKSITSIGLSDYDSVYVFEGFFDFLAFATRNRQKETASGYLILNGISAVWEAIKTLNAHNISTVSLMMDNDAAWQKATRDFQEHLNAKRVKDESKQYANFSDYSAMREFIG